MKAYSIDLRQRVLAAIDRGMGKKEVVTVFGISLATIRRLLMLRQERGDLSPKSPPGRPRNITAEQEEALRAQLEADSDATLEAQARQWEQSQGMVVSRWTLGRAIRRLDWTRKKRP